MRLCITNLIQQPNSEHLYSSTLGLGIEPSLDHRLDSARDANTKPVDNRGSCDFSQIPIALTNGQRLQPKLTINQPGDQFEQEADRVADLVMRMPEHGIQRKCGSCGANKESAECPECKKKRETEGKIQLSAESWTQPDDSVPPIVSEVLRTPGSPLPATARNFMESRFNHDFSMVRVHTDETAARSARAVHASAYTFGKDIVFGDGQFAVGTATGQELLAHELTHVIQQGASRGNEQNVKVEVDTQAGMFGQNSQLLQRRTAIGELPQTSDIDFDALADQIFTAIDGIGTDEEAVYQALQQLRTDQSLINQLVQTYRTRHSGADLIADIYDDFSGTELEYALQLLGRGKSGSQQTIDKNITDLNAIAKRLFDAMDPIGTDEEAVFAALLPFNRDTTGLEQVYHYQFNEPLRKRIVDEMSGAERTYALSLLSFDAEAFLEEYFDKSQRTFARKILVDIRSVNGDRLDFANDSELAAEVIKRMRVGQLMQESQTNDAFGYPESCLESDCPGACKGNGKQGQPDYIPPDINFNAHVNADARNHWVKIIGTDGLYLFVLSSYGIKNPYESLKKLFTKQDSICDRTLLHCDYLINMIHFRSFAESLGEAEFNRRVQSNEIYVGLSYFGFVHLMGRADPTTGAANSPRAVSLQSVRPSSEKDLLIGDHVIFWNHLAYDALTASPAWFGPWRLENALLVDIDDSGNDLYEGHGAPETSRGIVPGSKERMLEDMIKAYNGPAQAAINLTRSVDVGDVAASQELQQQFPRVERNPSGGWRIQELVKNSPRPRRYYELRLLAGVNDPELVGLRDPEDPSKMGWVKRPIESAPGRSPSR